jgi:hypothetical protein
MHLNSFLFLSLALLCSSVSAQAPTPATPAYYNYQETVISEVISAGNEKISLLIEHEKRTGSIFYAFSSGDAAYRIDARSIGGSRNLQFQATIQTLDAPPREVLFSAQDLASARFAPIRSLQVPEALAGDAIDILKGLPVSAPEAERAILIGLSLVDPLRGSNRPAIAGIFYASEYWGCVLGGGGWRECGDIARQKWGYN